MFIRQNKKLLVIIGTAVILYLYQNRDALCSIGSVALYSVMLMLTLSPLCRKMEEKGIWPEASAFFALMLVVLVVALLLSVFIPYLVSHGALLISRSTPVAGEMLVQAAGFLDSLGMRLFQHQGLTEMIGGAASDATAFFARAGVAFAAQAGRLFISVVIAYYLLRERKSLTQHFLLLIPIARRTVFLCVIRSCKNAVLGYLCGLLKTCAFVSCATYAGLLLIGIPDAFLLAVFMGLFEVLPYVGPVLAAIPIVLCAIPMGLKSVLLALALVFLVQQVESSVIGPYFTAASTSVHPAAAIGGVFVFGSFWGLWGILLAVPIMVIVQSVCWSLRQTAQTGS
ncbi:MAG: AI-2E family transporter [Clostridia bacterium]|nr:AI-2E family transporter [Clostridia bacterium]